ncbi:hypothetical protein C8J57DRAFT_1503578 [Mycena rebaudengoi]|nr:hypothetical protein C8J57DRAFT_1503578 [Mycena rebaudengoi]
MGISALQLCYREMDSESTPFFYSILHFHLLLAAWPPPLAPSRHGPCAPPAGLVVQSRLQHLTEPSRLQGVQQIRRFAVSPLDGAVLLVCTSFLSYPTAFLSLPSPPSAASRPPLLPPFPVVARPPFAVTTRLPSA